MTKWHHWAVDPTTGLTTGDGQQAVFQDDDRLAYDLGFALAFDLLSLQDVIDAEYRVVSEVRESDPPQMRLGAVCGNGYVPALERS